MNIAAHNKPTSRREVTSKIHPRLGRRYQRRAERGRRSLRPRASRAALYSSYADRARPCIDIGLGIGHEVKQGVGHGRAWESGTSDSGSAALGERSRRVTDTRLLRARATTLHPSMPLAPFTAAVPRRVQRRRRAASKGHSQVTRGGLVRGGLVCYEADSSRSWLAMRFAMRLTVQNGHTRPLGMCIDATVVVRNLVSQKFEAVHLWTL